MASSGSIFVLGSFVGACSVKVDRFPLPGESLRAESFTLEAGGKGFNLAVGARRLGAEIDGLLAVGEDLFATLAEAALARADLPQDMLTRLGGESGAGVGFIDGAGENCLAVYPGANSRLSAREVTAAGERLARARLVLAQFEIGDEPIAAAFPMAREAGAITILNPSPYRPIASGVLRQTDILVVNQVEAASLCMEMGLGDAGLSVRWPTLGDRLFEQGLKALVVTLGAAGAAAWTREGASLRQLAFKAPAVDTMGAGDAFTAGLAASLHEGLDLAQALRRGAACGAMAAARLGVLDALPGREALLAFLDAAGQAGGNGG
ncbi:MAG: ribokinase [Caulobacteraceae bacterium]|nr:ribokinase [Caulobacteraceae bacterium]